MKISSKFLTQKEWEMVKKCPTNDELYPYPKKKAEDWHSYNSPFPLYKMFKDLGIDDSKDKQKIVRTFWRLRSLDERYFYIFMFYSRYLRVVYEGMKSQKLDTNAITRGWQDW